MMKNIAKLTAVVAATAALASFPAYAGGGGSSTVAATAIARVITPVTIAQTTGLDFGTFAPGTDSAGTIDTSGNVTGGVNVVTVGNPGAFAVSGVSSANYTIVGDAHVTLKGTATSSPDMIAALTYPSSPRTLDGSGNDSFNVTGKLDVAKNQAADTYNGVYSIYVHY